MLPSRAVLHEAGDEYVVGYNEKAPAPLQKSEAGASQLAGIGEPFNS